mmetsp:Transcript_15800/g.36127  ORF Transcript_15800/g.36127 Transcript_15800/m.36127 type:complete len:130 (+) Transcript_15800:259-648(+)
MLEEACRSLGFSSLDLSSNRVWSSFWSLQRGVVTVPGVALKLLSLLYVFLATSWFVCASAGQRHANFGFVGESVLLWGPRVLEALLLPFLYDSVHERGRHRLLSPLSYNSGHIKPAGTTFVMLAGEMPG